MEHDRTTNKLAEQIKRICNRLHELMVQHRKLIDPSASQPVTCKGQSGEVSRNRLITTRMEWCRRGESNPRPRDYETLALPLSYAGTRT